MTTTSDPEAPLTVTSPVARPRAPGQVGREDKKQRSASAAALASRLRWLVPVALAAPALTVPVTWLAVSVVAALGALVVRERKALGGGAGSVLVAPARALRSGLGGLVGGAVTATFIAAVMAVLLPAAIGILGWQLSEGGTGTLVAGRLAIVHWAPALCAVVVCALVLRGSLFGRPAATGPLVGLFDDAGEGALAALAAACGVVALIFVLFVGPSPLRLEQLLPGALDEPVEEVQLDRAQAQVDAVLDCLLQRSGVRWTGVVYPAGDGLTAQVIQRGGGERRAQRADRSAVGLALHEQLIGAVTRFDVSRRAGASVLTIDRTELARPSSPLTTTTDLAAAAGVPPNVFPASERAVENALSCGAVAF